ncbi:cupin domain-containing protein [Saliterribacillus persicus]|uniref:Cupin domain n=1 Tax=Saliterribacillus persicus TaxID=930114 RepID=A0A368YBM2_9BACI|nr:cupin domain-containing protein [Saliterribacillus persicus]RCW76736.1 cupin domain [Saliterribacillus persicus]
MGNINEWEQAEEGVKRKIHSPGEKVMMMEVVFEKGAKGSKHAHPHEQLTYCLKGKLRFEIAGEEVVLAEGESVHIPSNKEHGVTALEESKLLDVFTPLREDLLS